MGYIDADELIDKIAELQDLRTISTKTLGKIIKKCATVDAVEVVRCSECIMHNNCTTEDAFKLCGIENPFCCAGKRMEPVKPPEAVEESNFFMERFMRQE